MKFIYVVTSALVVCGLTASAINIQPSSIEQVLDFSVTGWYQGIPTTNGVIHRDRAAIVRITSDNIVRALAIDRDTNFYRGRLFYKTALDGSATNIVIRVPGKTAELNVTDAFTWETGPFIVDQLFNTNTMVTNSYVETGLRSVSFTSSSVSFTNRGLAEGTLTRTRKISAFVSGTVKSGYANMLSYTGGGGTIAINTNFFYTTNFQFVATNTVTGPAQINIHTYAPVILPY
ncbi:MAG: hypothetical protein JWO95_95 [Verrucomicrobiales bacterium]|nr:hypothetical protein [Verrucomicrobiales bacterium]